MSEPLAEHLSGLMGGEIPSEEDLRKSYEENLKNQLEDEENVITDGESESDDEDDESSETLEDETDSDDEDEVDEGDEGDDEPMSAEEMRAALLAAEEERDEARREADGRLKALKENRGVANDLKSEIADLKKAVEVAIPKEPEVPAPDKEEDPLGYAVWQQENVVVPLVKTVEELQNGLKQIQMHSMLSEIEGGLNQHIASKIGSDKLRMKEFEDARNYMIEAYQKQLMQEEGATEQSVAAKIRIIAADAGARVMREGGDFAAFVVEQAKKAGWKPATESPVKKVKRGQKTNKMAGGSSRRNKVRGRKVTSAMMNAPDGEALSHDEKIAIIGDDNHRRDLMTKGFTYIQE